MRSRTDDILVPTRKIIRFYGIYTLILALSLIIIDSLDIKNALLAGNHPTAFLLANTGYVVLSAIFIFLLQSRVIKNDQILVALSWFDILLLAIMVGATNSSGQGNIANLIFIPIIVVNILSPNILGYATAAWASILLGFSQYYFTSIVSSDSLFSFGIFGLQAFLLAFFAQAVSSRLIQALNVASEQSKNIIRLRRINKRVLSNLPTGVIACDQEHKILYFNKTALTWFALKEAEVLDQDLMSHLNQHKDEKRSTYNKNGVLLNISHSKLYGSEKGDYLVTIEDAHVLAQQAQQVKLASLGRLTASIAHEIRNPLSALRHASQLLGEDDQLSTENTKLTNIIEQHCLRINRTIEDILQISRRNTPAMETLKLKPWLEHFLEMFNSAHSEKYSLTFKCDKEQLIQFDPDQLQQILHSLCDNALRYARLNSGDDAAIQIVVKQNLKQLSINISDNGPGISAEHQDNIFDPFFTTEHAGTGLGLYLCKEICEANFSNIKLKPTEQGCCFSIYTFNH